MSFAPVASAVLAQIQEQELPVPSVVFPIIAISIFILLGAVTFSYRDVANRHAGGKAEHGTPQGH